MNLMENGNKKTQEEELPFEDKHEEIVKREKKTKPKAKKKEAASMQPDTKILAIAFLLVVILILLLVIFVMWRSAAKSKNVSQDSLQESILDFSDKLDEGNGAPETGEETVVETTIEKENSETEANGNSTAASSDTVKSGSSNESHSIIVSDVPVDTSDEVLSKPAVENDPLTKDMYYEDYSYQKEFILQEMTEYWKANRIDAIYDLAALRRYRKLSYSLKDTKDYYYLGERNADNEPSGKGLAIYADDTYYYGQFVNGKRDGEGSWYRFYFDTTMKGSKNGRYTLHSYTGSWKDNLPDGAGVEHFDTDLEKFEMDEMMYQNVIGGFKKGRYNGEMYCTTINYEGAPGEWDGIAEEGVFKLQRELTAIGESPVWVNRADSENYIKLPKGENKDCGITELIQEVEK